MTDDDALLRRRRPRGVERRLWEGAAAAATTAVLVALGYLFHFEHGFYLPDTLRPPPSTARGDVVPAVAVSIERDGLTRVDARPIGNIRDPAFATRLREELGRRREMIEFLSHAGPFEGRLMLIADGLTPYAAISDVMQAAMEARYTSFGFVTTPA